MGKGAVSEKHPLSLGPVGYFMGTRGRCKFMSDMVEGADVVLLIGNRTNQNGTDGWQLYPEDARYIHIDIDPQEIGRNYEAELRIVADARLAIEALTEALTAADLSKRQAARSDVEKQIAKGLDAHVREVARVVDMDHSPVRPERMMRDLNGVLRADDIVAADASYSSIWVANFLEAQRPGQRILTPRGLAGLGWGLPYALGAKAARPASRVVGLVGDGGFAHVWSELETSRRMGLAITLIVLNNQILGYQKHAEKVIWGDHSDVVDFCPVDHAAIARACGVEGVRVDKPAAFLPALERALAADITTVIDVITDEHAYPPVTIFENNARLDH